MVSLYWVIVSQIAAVLAISYLLMIGFLVLLIIVALWDTITYKD